METTERNKARSPVTHSRVQAAIVELCRHGDRSIGLVAPGLRTHRDGGAAVDKQATSMRWARRPDNRGALGALGIAPGGSASSRRCPDLEACGRFVVKEPGEGPPPSSRQKAGWTTSVGRVSCSRSFVPPSMPAGTALQILNQWSASKETSCYLAFH
jgi:hypothetical protein